MIYDEIFNVLRDTHAQQETFRHFTYMKMFVLIVVFLQMQFSLTNFAEHRVDESYIASFLSNTKTESKTIGIVNSYTTNCIDINFLIKSPIILANDGHVFAKNTPKIGTIYIFLQDLNSVNETLNQMDNYFVYDGYGKYYFFVCEELENDNWISDVSELIWKHSILDFVLIYEKTSLNVIGYNPFNKTILNFTGLTTYSEISLFPNKLANMHGYEMKVAIFYDYPNNVYEDGKFTGLDGNLLTMILETYNATVKFFYFETMLEAVKTFYEIKKDFVFIGMPALSNYNVFKDSDSIAMDDIVVLVPRRDVFEHFNTILNMFNSTTAFILFASIWMSVIAFTQLMKKFDKTNNQNRGNSPVNLLELITISVNMPISKFSRRSDSKKIYITVLFYAALIFQNLFTTALLGVFISRKRASEMKTLDELAEAEIPIYIDTTFCEAVAYFIPNLTNNILNLTQANITDSLRNFRKNGAYALPKSYMHTFGHDYLEIRHRFEDTYFKLAEHLIPTHKVYLFPHRSPYINLINRMISIQNEFMLNARWKFREFTEKRKGKCFQVLKMSHMKSTFYVHALGLLVSIMIFFAEIVVYKL